MCTGKSLMAASIAGLPTFSLYITNITFVIFSAAINAITIRSRAPIFPYMDTSHSPADLDKIK